MSPGPVIETQGLSKEFLGPAGETVKAVHEVDLTVQAGDILLLLGPSGSGKTTFLSLLAGILPSSAGMVRVGGQDLTALEPNALQTFRLTQLGVVFQNARLIDGLSAVENVELPLNMAGQTRPQSRRRALGLLHDVGLGHRTEFAVDALSGGEKQRVSVARALALAPGIVLADEPTAMVDAEAGALVVETLCSAARSGAALLIVSHDSRLAKHATRVLRMEGGRISES